MKILRKQYNWQYKGKKFFYYTRRIWLGVLKENWQFWGVVWRKDWRRANTILESKGYEFPEFGDWR